MQIITIIGARPQFIKAAAVSRAITNYGTAIREQIIHTGQHYDSNMSDVFFEELAIPEPKFNLGIGGGTHGQNTGRMIEAIENILLNEKPDAVLVYGDTDSTLAGAIAATKIQLPIIHIESGLRSFNRRMPEEINRILTDHASDFLFTPTSIASDNLSREGIPRQRIFLVGDVMLDSTKLFGEISDRRSNMVEALGLSPKKYVLATIHRKESTDDKRTLTSIVQGIGCSSEQIIGPIHPRTKNRIEQMGLSIPSNITFIEPVGYLDMLQLEKHARLIATDSGGIQKEAYFHGIPCLTVRSETEWTELVDAGWNVLANPNDFHQITQALKTHDIPPNSSELMYGDGKASEKIIEVIDREIG